MPPFGSFKRSASDDWAASAPPSASGDHKRLKTEASGDGCGSSVKPFTKAFTHVYLCIDRSGSMNNQDVATPDGVMSRYDAVFAAAAHLVQVQKGKGIDFSLILWNDEAEWIFRNRNAEESLSLLAEAKSSSPPRLGTNFSNCFRLLRECIVGEVKDEINRPGSDSASSLVIFLSDGRPGDLRKIPPNLGEQIQPTYRRHKQTYESVGGHLCALEPHLSPGALHFVGIHESGYAWLQCLAERYNGTFHRSTLHFGQADNNGGGDEPPPAGDAMNGDNENEPRIQAAAAAVANQENVNVVGEQNLNMGDQDGGDGGNDGEEEEEAAFDPNVTDGNEHDNDDDDDDEDDDFEFVEEVSANERIRRNIANGEVISVASQSQSQSIMDTFSSLSQTISIYHESQQQQSQGYNDDDDGDDENLYADDL